MIASPCRALYQVRDHRAADGAERAVYETREPADALAAAQALIAAGHHDVHVAVLEARDEDAPK